jgi:hypothetical protein
VRVVVDESCRLHEGVADGGAYEREAARAQIATERARRLRLRRHLAHRPPWLLQGPATHEAPHVGVEAAMLTLHGDDGARIGDGRLDLGAVTDDAGVGEETRHAAPSVVRDLTDVEPIERAPVSLAAREHRGPAEPCLCALEDEELEERSIVVDRDAPFLVVIADHLLASRPLATALHRLGLRAPWRRDCSLSFTTAG